MQRYWGWDFLCVMDLLRVMWEPCWCKSRENTTLILSFSQGSWEIVRTGCTFGTDTSESWAPEIRCAVSSNVCSENMPNQTWVAQTNLFVYLTIFFKVRFNCDFKHWQKAGRQFPCDSSELDAGIIWAGGKAMQIKLPHCPWMCTSLADHVGLQ